MFEFEVWYVFRLDILIILKNKFTWKFYLKYKSLYSKSRSMLEYIHSSLDRPSTLRIDFNFLSWNSWWFCKSRSMFEYIHSSFPERKCSTEPIFSEIMNTFTLHLPIENVLQSQSFLKWSLLWNEVFSETRGFEYIYSSFPDWKRSPEPIFSEKMNTFTLHFPIENVIQSQSSLKWWIHSLFIARSTMFYRANLLWNDEYIHSSFPDQKRYPEPIFSEMKSSLKWSLLLSDSLSLSFSLSLSLSTGGRDLVASFSVDLYQVQLTLQSAVFLRHATFQAFYMQFDTVWEC